jgi:hypothetical protein
MRRDLDADVAAKLAGILIVADHGGRDDRINHERDEIHERIPACLDAETASLENATGVESS